MKAVGIAVAGVVGLALVLHGGSGRAAREFAERGRAYRPDYVEQTGELGRRLRESSGVAASRSQPGVLWTHNDSGDDPQIYAVDLSGHRLARYDVNGADAVDWEDVALGRCPPETDAASCLYVADTGDNLRTRSVLHIYIFAEPTLDSLDGRRGEVELVRDLAFVYPDEPHDAEALGVTPEGDLIIVTKGRTGEVNVYLLPIRSIRTAGLAPITAEYQGTLPIEPQADIGRLVTGGAVSQDGNTLVIRTYTEVFFLKRDTGSGPVMTDRRCFIGDLALGGEAIDFYDDSTLVVTSERASGVPGRIYLFRCT